jgi:two-component system, chemotaxis family, sensor kinase Cph1
VLSVVTDVTEQRRMEDELRDYAKVAAHDLREPIMAAGYFTELLARRLADDRTAETEQLLEGVRRTHARARSLVDGVLEYACPGTSLAADPVDTHELMGDVAASLANAVERLHGRLEIAALPTVRGDRAQLGRVFQNLVANGLERHDAAWLFNVRDNGVGVPPELSDEIFSMFKRAHGEEIEGCGIGLAVCRKIIKAHALQAIARDASAMASSCRYSRRARLDSCNQPSGMQFGECASCLQ